MDGLRERRPVQLDLVLACAAWASLAYGTIMTMANGVWQADDGSFAPLVMVLAIGMAISIARHPAPSEPAISGLPVLVVALLTFLAGILLNNLFMRGLGLWGAVLGMTAFMGGWRRVARYGYPFFAALFALPLPGSLTIALTFPIKLAISNAATFLLWHLHYPVANSGVIIEIGAYRLLVADACSGLQSMYSLIATAIFFLFLMQVRRSWTMVLLLASTAPIIFVLNTWRVVTLALITYYLGDAAGRSFLHSVAGYAMFIMAFGCFALVHRLSARLG